MRTNNEMLQDLNTKYSVLTHIKGVVTMKEIYLINSELELDGRSEVELRNLRDFIVLWFNMEINCNMDNALKLMDQLSAYTSVIDNKLFNMGCEI